MDTCGKCSNIFLRIVIMSYFMKKMLSDSILDLAKCPNRKTCTFTFMRFSFGALSEVQNWIWKHFSHKVLYNYCSKIFLEIFGSYLRKSKMDFPLHFQILRERVWDFFLQARKLFFFAKWLVLNNCEGPQGFDFDMTFLFPIIVTPYPSQSKQTDQVRDKNMVF